MEPEIIQMRESGKSRQEIAEALGLEKRQVIWWVSRYNRRKKAGVTIAKHKGRPRKTPITTEHEKDLRIKELEREVELYRSFLHAAGRM